MCNICWQQQKSAIHYRPDLETLEIIVAIAIDLIWNVLFPIRVCELSNLFSNANVRMDLRNAAIQCVILGSINIKHSLLLFFVIEVRSEKCLCALPAIISMNYCCAALLH